MFNFPKALEKKIVAIFKAGQKDGFFPWRHYSWRETSYPCPRCFIRPLQKLGFKKIKYIGCVFANEDYVVKIPGIVVGRKPKNSIPTKIIKIGHEEIWIQPRANTRFSHKTKIIDKLFERDMGEDLHNGNIGYYKGKLVVFDW